jgi:ubiquinone/menaquinone biosynthesis C-methylase UbiE
MSFFNSYEDETRAKAYATLEFHNDYYLAFRDLPAIFRKYVKGKKALDFGCGTGRSTRFLKQYGFSATGIDISTKMIQIAKTLDPMGEYHVVRDGDYSQFSPESFDLILSAFTFDNIPHEKKDTLFLNLTALLHKNGTLINLVSSPEMYTNEWASFTTKDFPENKHAKSGDIVKIITTEFADKRPCDDIFCTDTDYKKIYFKAGLQIIFTTTPVATGKEPYPWVNETTIAPWTIYILQRKY